MRNEVTSPAPAGGARDNRFRDAMARVAYSVCVVTTDGGAGRDGLTVTAMLPVSDAGSEPVILVCIRARSRALPTILGNGAFCVNVLGEEHASIADRLAGRERTDNAGWFADVGWTTLTTGAPALEDAIAAFDCRVLSRSRVGSHEVLFGAVLEVKFRDAGSPLLHAQRSYQRLRPLFR